MTNAVAIGRIVHFIDSNGDEWPAIITMVHSDTLVTVQAFRQFDIEPALSVPYDNSTVISEDCYFTWHWPQRA